MAQAQTEVPNTQNDNKKGDKGGEVGDNSSEDSFCTPGVQRETDRRKRRHAKKKGDDSSSESSNDARRLRWQCKPLVLADPPQHGALRTWLGDFFTKIQVSSKRSGKRTLAWARKVLYVNSPDELLKVSSRWEDLDSLLANSVMSIARGPLKRELLQYQEQLLQRGVPMCGRAAMYLMLRRYHIDGGTSMQHDLAHLMSLRYDGDLEIFLDKFDTYLFGNKFYSTRGDASCSSSSSATKGEGIYS
jgi:hypothetical protein